MLEDEHGFDVESVAHKGDRVEDMAFSPGQLDEFSRRLEKVLRGGVVPRAILLSGGGNDLAGTMMPALSRRPARWCRRGGRPDGIRPMLGRRFPQAR